jgi:hypothetical protein
VYGNEKEEKRKKTQGQYIIFSRFFFSRRNKQTTGVVFGGLEIHIAFFPDFGRGAGGWE